MKKIIVIILVILAFFLTNKITNYYKENDTIMKQLKTIEKKYKKKAKDAIVIGDNIIPGIKGKTINYNESYRKIKTYGKMNENLITTKEVIPTISIEDNYDKYIIKGNNEKRYVSLVFKVEKNTNINKILSILKNNKVNATFFVDGKYIEDNINIIKSNNNHEYEVLSYNNEYNKSIMKTTFSYLESLTKKKLLYCYTEENNDYLKDLCKEEKMHTIKPSLVITNHLYNNIKNNIQPSQIVSININNYNVDDLSISIKYLKSKGYKLVLLKELISE